jgi:hypothetical protein
MSVIIKSVLVLCLFLIPYEGSAEELWPESFDVTIEAGAVGSAELALVNDQDDEAIYQIDLIQVHIGETRDELTFSSLDEDLESWIIVDDDALSLAANTQGTIGLRFSPSQDLEPQVATIGVQVTRQNQDSLGIGVQTSIVSLGFITVGAVQESVEWLDVTIEANGLSLPVTGLLSVRNEGERVVIPQGTMRITSLFGREVALSSVNVEGSRVVSGQTRTFTTYWGEQEEDSRQPFAIGVFTVDLEIQPWEDGEVFNARQHIILFPWLGALVALVILGLLAWMHKFSRS